MHGARNSSFSFKNIQPSNRDVPYEIPMRIRKALEVIRTFAMQGGCSHETIAALKYIEQECPKVQVIVNDMRLIFFNDDKFPEVDAGRLRRVKLQLCSDLEKHTQKINLINKMSIISPTILPNGIDSKHIVFLS